MKRIVLFLFAVMIIVPSCTDHDTIVKDQTLEELRERIIKTENSNLLITHSTLSGYVYIIRRDLLYTKSHEWVQLLSDSTYKTGITDYKSQNVGILVHVELPSEGEIFSTNNPYAEIESVMTAEDVFIPFGGEIRSVNSRLEKHPELVYIDPYNNYFVTVLSKNIKPSTLMDYEKYKEYIKGL